MLANYIVDKHKELQFNVPDVTIKRDDDNRTREYILNMTPEQRKELGITNLRFGISGRTWGKKVKLYYEVRLKSRNNKYGN